MKKIKLCLGLIVSLVLLSGCSELTTADDEWQEPIYLAANTLYIDGVIVDPTTAPTHNVTGTEHTFPMGDGSTFLSDNGTFATIPFLPNATLSSSVNQTAIGMLYTNNVTFNSNDQLVGITHSTASNTSQIWIQSAGAYLITFSAVAMSSAPNKHIDIWFRKNGTDVARSNTHYELQLSGENLVTVTNIQQLLAGEYIELVWASTDDANMKLLATNAATTPTRPASPSVILTINKVSD